ncbi:MAG TPA: GNAT family N-acetyltransferase [Terriglobia bacterium]|jgi:RimJ/RimL family protein N-acetyltransferase
MRILDTGRLYLRTWETSDFPLARSLWADPDVMTFLGGPLSDDRILAKIQSEIVCAEQHGVQYWPIFETRTNDFVGCCGLRPWAYSPPAGHETGFALVKAKWEQGYASEIAGAVVKHAFETLQLPMLRAGHHPEHRNSKKILLRLGFQFVDEVFYKPTGLMHPTYQLKNGGPPERILG